MLFRSEAFLSSCVRPSEAREEHLIIVPGCSDLRELARSCGGVWCETEQGFLVSKVWGDKITSAIQEIVDDPCWVRSSARSRERSRFHRARSPRRSDAPAERGPTLDPQILEGDSSGNSSEEEDEDSDFPGPDSPRDHEREFRVAFRRRVRALRRHREAKAKEADGPMASSTCHTGP